MSAELETEEIFDDVNKFLAHFGARSLQHFEYAEAARVADQCTASMTVCDKCYMPNDTCSCGKRTTDFCQLCYLSWNACDCVQGEYADYMLFLLLRRLFLFCLHQLVSFLFWALVVFSMQKYGALVRLIVYLLRYCHSPLQVKIFAWINATNGVLGSEKFKQTLFALQFILSACIGYYGYQALDRFNPKRKQKEKEAKCPNGHGDDCTLDCLSDDSCDNMSAQGNVFGTTEAQLAKETARNVWYNPNVELTRFDLPATAVSLQKFSESQLRDYFAPNCVHLDIKAEDDVYRCRTHGVFVTGQYLLLNGHTVRKGNRFAITITEGSNCEAVTPNITVHVSREQFLENPELDVVLVKLNNVPPRKDILRHWTDKHLSVTRAISVSRDMGGLVSYTSVYHMQHESSWPIASLELSMPIYLGKQSEATSKGDCGSLAIAMTPQGPCIIGIHILGFENNVGFAGICKSDLAEMIEGPVVTSGVAPKFQLDGPIS